MDEALWIDIEESLNESGISLSSDQVSQLGRHMEAVLRANRELNLTRITKPTEFVRLHILDSLLVLREVDAAPAGRIADIGAGAGFPGIPLAISTGRQTILIESVGKKAAFLNRVAAELDIVSQVSVYSGRSEEFALEHPSSCAVVVARAVAPLPCLVELATPLLESGGVFIAMKGKIEAEELRAGDAAAGLCGLSPASDRSYRLPVGGDERRAIVYLKTNESSIELPRRPGMARKRPIA